MEGFKKLALILGASWLLLPKASAQEMKIPIPTERPQRRAEVEAKNKELFQAVREGNLERVKALLQQGAQINATNEKGHTPLHWAPWYGHPEIGLFLIEQEANVHVKSGNGDTPLHLAASHGDTDLIKRLIEKEADVNAEDNGGHTVLHYAAWNGHTPAIQILLEAGAHIHTQDSTGRTPVDVAEMQGHKESLKFFQDYKKNQASQRAPKEEVSTATDDTFVLRLKLSGTFRRRCEEAGVFPKEDGKDREKMMFDIIWNDTRAGIFRDAKEVETLICQGADVNARYEGTTPLLEASFGMRTEIVRVLVDAGADVNATYGDKHYYKGKPPIHNAVDDLEFNKSDEYLQDVVTLLGILLDGGADIDAVYDGRTPLYYSVAGGKKRVTEFLAARGANVDIKNKEGYPILFMAARRDLDLLTTKRVRALLEGGADVNAKDPHNGWTLLKVLLYERKVPGQRPLPKEMENLLREYGATQ